MFPVADHNGVCRLNVFLRENVGDELGFVSSGAVRFAAVNFAEDRVQPKVIDNTSGEYSEFIFWRSAGWYRPILADRFLL